jgi:hypothetical protein
LTELATMMGWLLPGSRPNKPKAQRMSNTLVRAKMVTKGFQDKLRLTKEGERAIADTAETPDTADTRNDLETPVNIEGGWVSYRGPL